MKTLFIVLLFLTPSITFAIPSVQDIQKHGIITVPQIEAVYAKAKAGDAFSQAELGQSLINGSIGVLPNYPQALYWLNKAAKQHSALAYFNLAMIYLAGDGVNRDKDKFYEYAKLGLEAYNKDVSKYTSYQKAETEYQVAELYLWGVPGLVKQDTKKAFALFKHSAEDGFVHSISRITMMYRYGIGTTADLEKAHQWTELLAKTGSATFQYVAGMDYLNGVGVIKDEENAVAWLHQAALKDYMPAIVELAKLKKMNSKFIKESTLENWLNLLNKAGDNILELRSVQPSMGKF